MEGTQGLDKQSPKTPGPFLHDCSFNSALNPNGKSNYLLGYCGYNGGQAFIRLSDVLGRIYELDIHYTSLHRT